MEYGGRLAERLAWKQRDNQLKWTYEKKRLSFHEDKRYTAMGLFYIYSTTMKHLVLNWTKRLIGTAVTRSTGTLPQQQWARYDCDLSASDESPCVRGE